MRDMTSYGLLYRQVRVVLIAFAGDDAATFLRLTYEFLDKGLWSRNAS